MHVCAHRYTHALTHTYTHTLTRIVHKHFNVVKAADALMRVWQMLVCFTSSACAASENSLFVFVRVRMCMCVRLCVRVCVRTQVVKAADALRERVCGKVVTHTVNRNINYTNVCTFGCGFCAFSKGKVSGLCAKRTGLILLCYQRNINLHQRVYVWVWLLRLLKRQGERFVCEANRANFVMLSKDINYTNVCTFGCGFCAFSKGKVSGLCVKRTGQTLLCYQRISITPRVYVWVWLLRLVKNESEWYV